MQASTLEVTTPSPPGVASDPTEATVMTALGQFARAYCSPSPITVIRALGATAPGSNVRVPEPIQGDFVVLSSIHQGRLDTNLTTFSDNVFVGSIAGNVLTVSSVSRGTVAVGQLITDRGYPNGSIKAGTAITGAVSVNADGTGTYAVSVPQSLPKGTLYSGTRTDLVGTEWTVQLDVHGPNGADNANVLDTLFRSEVGTDFLEPLGVSPLHIDSRGLQPFVNGESEVEWRWVLEAHVQVNVAVTTPQQFFDEAVVHTVEVAPNYVP